MPRKKPMPARERAICHRLREFRLRLGFSQAILCGIADMNHGAYASYEYGRSQLNYPAAWRILSAFHMLNPIWLAEGTGNMLEGRVFEYPNPESIGEGPRTPFSRVYDEKLKRPLREAPAIRFINEVKPGGPFDRITQDVRGRIDGADRINGWIGRWLADRPDASVRQMLNDIFEKAAQAVSRYPRDRDRDAIEKRLAEAAVIQKRRYGSDSAEESQKRLLTALDSSVKETEVKSPMEVLRDRLNAATQERGMKSELAKALKLPLETISRYLSGTVEPGGEITLRLLRWVEQQERK